MRGGSAKAAEQWLQDGSGVFLKSLQEQKE